MKRAYYTNLLSTLLLFLLSSGLWPVCAQASKEKERFKKASKKLERGFEKNNSDTLAQGYFELGENYYQKGELEKSELYFLRSKTQYEKIPDAEGIAKSSRALAKVQEELHKDKEAINSYNTAQQNSAKAGDSNANALNLNDITRLSKPDSFVVQQKVLLANIGLGIKNKDTGEIVSNYSRMGALNLQNNATKSALGAYNNAYQFSKNMPQQAVRFNQLITDVYVKDKNFSKAIETKKAVLAEPFVQNSTRLQASEIGLLAEIYLKKNETDSAIGLLKESYQLAVNNAHTLEARNSIEKLDSIYQRSGNAALALQLHRDFVERLPFILDNDSTLTDEKLVAATEEKIKKLEAEKALKDELIEKKNLLNNWLGASLLVLLALVGAILYVLKKLQIKNRKIALQSLRREMNPHFIFNSLNSINQFIANNNELEANQYLSKFSTLMRRVMENSKEDFVLFTKELELLQHYLELEKSRFPDKFDFNIHVDNVLYAQEELYIPGMLIQPHLENAIWHGLRYIEEKGHLQVRFIKKENTVSISIEDNGIGIAESKRKKTVNQQQHSGRGIKNTLERIKILNELYHGNISCSVQDNPAPAVGVTVNISVPILKQQP
jgi:hypothetical protein